MQFLSNTLHNIVTTKLKTDVLKLKKEKFYLKMLSEKFSLLESNSDHKKFSFNRISKNYKKLFEKEKFFIVYIITVTFLKANTNINVSDIKGNVKLSFTSGSVNLIGKQKKHRLKSVSRLVSLLAKKATFLKNYPVAIHLHNVSSYKFLILKKLKVNFFIQLVKSFNLSPYNGCRKRKVRRKKYVKKFK
jgi:ribosomal protein S11